MLPPKGGWIMVNAVEGALRPAFDNIWSSTAPPEYIPEPKTAKNIDALAKPGLTAVSIKVDPYAIMDA
jgi:hypothetical protein